MMKARIHWYIINTHSLSDIYACVQDLLDRREEEGVGHHYMGSEAINPEKAPGAGKRYDNPSYTISYTLTVNFYNCTS